MTVLPSLERRASPQLTPERVAVGPHMTKHGETLVRPQNGADLFEGGVSHVPVAAALCEASGRNAADTHTPPTGRQLREPGNKLHRRVSAARISICCKISKTQARARRNHRDEDSSACIQRPVRSSPARFGDVLDALRASPSLPFGSSFQEHSRRRAPVSDRA